MIHTLLLKKNWKKKADNNNVLWRSSVIFRSLKRRIFFCPPPPPLRRRRHSRQQSSKSLIDLEQFPPWLSSSYDQHFTAAQRKELPLASLPPPWWWRCRRRRRHLQLENLNCDPQGKISNTITNLYTHTHIHTHRQPRAKPYLLIASRHPIYTRMYTHIPLIELKKNMFIVCGVWWSISIKYLLSLVVYNQNVERAF